MINFSKSSIAFGSNVPEQVKIEINNLLAVPPEAPYGKYLGLPSIVGRNKKATYGYVKERICNRLNGWNKKMLSRAGKEVLFKSIIQAISTFVISVFLLPSTLCDEIEKMMNSFWWGRNCPKKREICWTSWNKLCQNKCMGDMGFRMLRKFNTALLAKQGWRLLFNPSSLVARLYKARYFPTSSVLNANLKANPSLIWRSILTTQDIIRRGAIWRIGRGDHVQIWKDPWLPDMTNPWVTTPPAEGLEEALVASLKSEDGTKWDEDILSNLFNTRDLNLIK